MKWKENKDVYILFFVSLVAFLSVIWVREADLMETRNFISAREIVTNKSWWVTTLNGNLRFEKPPVPTWITAIWMKIFHNNTETILRLPNSILSSLFISYFYLKMKEFLKNRNLAFFSAFILSTTFMYIKTAAENTWDIYVYSFSFLASLLYFIYLQGEKKRNLYLFSIFLALSIMSKGPVGLYSTILPAIIASIIVDKKNLLKHWKKILFFLILGILLGSIWGIAMYFNYKEIFIEILKKEKNTWNYSHVKSVFFYLDYLIYMGIWIVFAAFSLLNKNIRKTKEEKLFFLWHLLVLIFISLIQMKKKRYGLPLYLTMSPIIGIFLEKIRERNISNFKEKRIFTIQNILINFILIISILFISFNYFIKSYINIYQYIIFIFLHLCLAYYLYFYKHTEYLYKIIFGTGFLMLIFNMTSSWLIDINYLKNKASSQVSFREIEDKKENLKIYSMDFSIEDVWKIGKEIKTLEKGNFPKEKKILYLGSKNLLEVLKEYEICNIYKKEKQIIYELDRKVKI